MGVNNNLSPTNNPTSGEVNRSNTPTPATSSRNSTPTADTATQQTQPVIDQTKLKTLSEIDELRKIALTLDLNKINPVNLNKKVFIIFRKEGKTPGTSKTYSINTDELDHLGEGSYGIALYAKATNLEEPSKKSEKVFKRAFAAGERKELSGKKEAEFLVKSERDIIKSYNTLHDILAMARDHFQKKLKLSTSEFEEKFGSNPKFTGIQSAPYNLTTLNLEGKKLSVGFMAKRYENNFVYLNDFKLKTNEQLGTKEKVEYAYQLIKGLQTLHAIGLIHGDIKIENVLYKKEKCDLIDFGGSLFVDNVKTKIKTLIEDYHKELNTNTTLMMKGSMSVEDFGKIKKNLRETVRKSIRKALTPTLTMSSFSAEELSEMINIIEKVNKTHENANKKLEKSENNLDFAIMEWENITQKMDLYGLGRTLYELFCIPSEIQDGLPETFYNDNFMGMHISDKDKYFSGIENELKKHDCPQELIDIIKLLLEPTPGKMYINIDDAQKKLQRYCESQNEYKYLPQKYVL